MSLKRRTSRTVLAALLLLVLAGLAAPSAQSTAAPPDLDAYVGRVLTVFDVPGLALSIVKDGQVVVAKGYGVRRKGEPAPVEPRTLFGIASNTKVVTAAALGLLVEDGKIEWDAPVIRYLPWFQMWDPYVTRELTVRDLLVHRSIKTALADRKAIYEKVTGKILSEGGIIYLYHRLVIIAHSERLEGYKQMPDGLVRVVGVKLKQ